MTTIYIKTDQAVQLEDSRQAGYFTCENHIVDLWVPILGSDLFGFYATLLRFANNGALKRDDLSALTIQRMADICRKTTRTIRKYLDILRTFGFIRTRTPKPMQRGQGERIKIRFLSAPRLISREQFDHALAKGWAKGKWEDYAGAAPHLVASVEDNSFDEDWDDVVVDFSHVPKSKSRVPNVKSHVPKDTAFEKRDIASVQMGHSIEEQKKQEESEEVVEDTSPIGENQSGTSTTDPASETDAESQHDTTPEPETSTVKASQASEASDQTTTSDDAAASDKNSALPDQPEKKPTSGDMIGAWWDALPARPADIDNPYKRKPYHQFARNLIEQGFTPDDVRAFVQAKTAPGQWYADKALYWKSVASDLPAWAAAHRKSERAKYIQHLRETDRAFYDMPDDYIEAALKRREEDAQRDDILPKEQVQPIVEAAMQHMSDLFSTDPKRVKAASEKGFPFDV